MSAAETRARTLLRAITWRILGVLLTVVLTWWYFRDVRLGVELGLAYNAIRLVMHYFHDRAWAHFSWGANAPAPVLPERKEVEPWC